MEGNRVPNIAGHSDTIVEQGGGWSTPSSASEPRNHQTLVVWNSLDVRV